MGRFLLIALAVLTVGFVGAGVWLYTPDRSRAELEATYLRAADDYRDVAGLRLHVRDEGPRDAPALVLIHGFGASLQTWDEWAADLATDHRVVRFDLPGHGLTGPDPTGDYSLDRTAAVLGELLDTLGMERATLIGNSLGGLTAWMYAADHPDRVDRLVLIAPGGFPLAGQVYGQAAPVPPTFKTMRYILPESGIKASFAPLYGDPSKLDAATIRRYWDMLRAPGVRQALVDRLEDFVLEDPVPRLSRIEAPTLLMWGGRDIMVPPAHAAKFADALPNEELVTYPDIGHMPMEEDPARTLKDLRAFLAR